MLFSSRPGGGVEVGVLEPLLDLVQEVPARGAIRNMIAGRATFVVSRVELANTHAWPMNVGTPMTFEYQFVFQLDTASVEYTAVYQVDTHSPGVPQGQLPYDAFPPKARQSCATLLARAFT